MSARHAAALAACLLAGIASAPAAIAAPQGTAPAAAPAPAAKESAELKAFRKAIRAMYDMKEKAWAAGDYETIVSKFYAQDMVSVGEMEGMFFGRDEIRPGYQENVKKYTVKVHSVRSYVNGNAGWDWADFVVTPREGNDKPLTLAMVFLWSKVDGKWICMGEEFVFGSIRTRKLEPLQAPAEAAPAARN